MELVRSNRTEILVDALASQVRDQPLSPFEQETIVVQSRGLESWLTLELARRLGVWGNPSFPFPRHLVEQVLEVLDPEWTEQALAYDRDRLRWTLASILSDTPPEELRDYLADDPDRILRFAGNVASVFDDYVVYRPDLLSDWTSGKRDGWESELWGALVAKLGPHDLASRMSRALGRLRQGDAELDLTRLHLFSLETLPPQFLRFFGELSKRVPTTLYVLEPSRQYLDDTGGARQLALPLEGGARDGHPFLIGTGRLARDFQQILSDADSLLERQYELFEEPGRDSLLRSLQADVLDFEPEPRSEERRQLPRSDRSISIHACTGPMREVQVLHDLVRDALERDPTLKPEDVVVMAPDLDTYAPIFRAVFGEHSNHRIPFDVHDRRSRDDSGFYDDFAFLLELLDSRFSVLDVVRLMDAQALREDFSFSSEERSRLTDLLSTAGVRWGIDADHREQEGFPRDELHTWRSGLGRLFLGFSMMPDSVDVFGSLLPRGAPTLDDAELIARLSRLCDVLFDVHARTRGPRTIDRWADELGRLCGMLFSEDDETSRATHLLRTTLNELRDCAERGGFEREVSLRTLRRELDRLLVEKTPAVGFLRRGVTLTELVPLRSVPFRMVCVVGMSEDAFPRHDRRPSFDRTRISHRHGDRNRRHDDRHSFLQAVLCARDQLVVTYSSPAGSHRVEPNPSPLVWELSECIDRYYEASDGEGPLVRAVVHPLHAFDPQYFGDPEERSFSKRHAGVARALAGGVTEEPRVTLSAEPEEQSVITVGELTKWLWDPSKAFIDDVLQARFETPSVYEPDNALIEVGPLEAANVGNAAIRSELSGDALETYLEACPEFPDGSLGAIARASLLGEIEAVTRRAATLRDGSEGRSLLLRCDLGEFLVEGRLLGVCRDTRVVPRFSRLGRRAELATWVEHLLMLSAVGASLPNETHLVLRGSDAEADTVRYARVENAQAELRKLVELYARCRRAPLPIFERASRDFVEKERDKGVDAAIRVARTRFENMRRYQKHLAFVVGPDDPFLDDAWTEAFAESALELYSPMYDHRSES